MDTTSDDKTTNGTNTTYRRIAGALWAGFGEGGNFFLGHDEHHAFTVQGADVDDLRAALGIEVKQRLYPGIFAAPEPTPGVARLFEDVQNSIKALQARVDAIVDGRSETMRLLVDRVQKCEEQRQTNYNYFCERMNKTDDVVGQNYRTLREADNQIAIQLNGDNTEDNPGIKSQVTQLLMLVDAINTSQEELQALVEKMAPGSLKVPELPPNIATKEYVDAATHRLSAALREHIGNVIAEAVRLAKPGPGLLRRIVDAVRNQPETPVAAARARAARERGGLTPEQAINVGAVAARVVVEGE